MAYNLQQQLKNKSISATIEKVNVPDSPFRALVNYQNINGFYWRILKITREEVRAERKKWQNSSAAEEKFLQHFIPKTPVKSGKADVPNDKDFQQHSVEIKLDGVPVSDYMVLISYDSSFRVSHNNLTYAFTTISNLSYINRNLDDGSTEINILNRTTGDPVADAKIQIAFQVYNSRSNRYEIVKGNTYTTNTGGSVKIPYPQRMANQYNSAFVADISWQTDRISTQDIDGYEYDYNGQISPYPYGKPERYNRTIFFLDRAIYRPGQTLYFKGLLFSADQQNPKILPNQTQTLTFYDVNQQVVADRKSVV